MKTLIAFLIVLTPFIAPAQTPTTTRPTTPVVVPKVPPKLPKQVRIIPATSAAFERTYAFNISGDYLDVWIDDASVLHFSSNKHIDKRSITTYASKADWMAKKGNEHIINTPKPVKFGDASLTTPAFKNMYAYVVTLHMVGAANNYQTIFTRK